MMMVVIMMGGDDHDGSWIMMGGDHDTLILSKTAFLISNVYNSAKNIHREQPLKYVRGRVAYSENKLSERVGYSQKIVQFIRRRAVLGEKKPSMPPPLDKYSP